MHRPAENSLTKKAPYKAGYIDAIPHLPDQRKLLQREAGPYIGSEPAGHGGAFSVAKILWSPIRLTVTTRDARSGSRQVPMRLRLYATRVLLSAAGVIYLTNSSLLVSQPASGPTLLAHRGMAQTYDLTGVTAETCTASHIHAPTHDHLENTIASMSAAFDLGADVVEFDVHPTTDGHFAVFHDWTLDCRTDGRGETRAHSLAELKKLDIGYGYTADNGKSFPFRGRGVGLMPSLDEVLAAFPDKKLLINVKSSDPKEGRLLADVLMKLPAQRLTRVMAYGGNAPIAELAQRLPQLRVMSRATLKSCLLRYMLVGWSGRIPDACQNTLILAPTNIAPFFWLAAPLPREMTRVGTQIFAVGPYWGGEYSTGIDQEADLRRLQHPAVIPGSVASGARHRSPPAGGTAVAAHAAVRISSAGNR
jgi:glycerophosphoryl diester phosphodiesterase